MSKNNEEKKDINNIEDDFVIETEEVASSVTRRGDGKKELFTNEDGEDFIIDSEEEINSSFGDKDTNKLREKLKLAIAEKQEYLDGWQRAKADLVNARKEFEEQRVELLKYSNTDLILQIIPVLDSFEMALKNIDELDKNLKEWSQGVKHIYSQLFSVLEANGVKQIDPLKEEFNPEFHIAVEEVKVDEKKSENIIVEVVQKGYILNNKVIREARVKVGQ
ncbi:MAG: nucleotide exchange factor GrpE [Candidatus Pacebacteria bacterium]|nr:nucleotide exchange factor GrpE [Candidatus Paceibacterota bacterium]